MRIFMEGVKDQKDCMNANDIYDKIGHGGFYDYVKGIYVLDRPKSNLEKRIEDDKDNHVLFLSILWLLGFWGCVLWAVSKLF